MGYAVHTGELGEHAITLQQQPSPRQLIVQATSQLVILECTRGPSGMVGVAKPIFSESFPH